MIHAIRKHLDALEDRHLAGQRLIESRAGRRQRNSLDDGEHDLGLAD
jgi:predicted DNA-binding protein